MAPFLLLQLEAWLVWICPLSPVSTLAYVFKNMLKNMLKINCSGCVTSGSMINDTIAFNQQVSSWEVASDRQPDQGSTHGLSFDAPDLSFDAPEVGLRAFLHATAIAPAMRRRFF
ncbi:MAG: hypothetical protein NT053_09720 [Cyanobacteria bacterium]|nr:hypothetical protein [Cyanobacteriota bacterium]